MSETKIVRILIEIKLANDQTWEATFSVPELPIHAAWQRTRTLVKKEIGDHNFPVVDTAESGLPDAEPHYALCTGGDPTTLEEMYDRIILRSPIPANNDVSTFGKYLFNTLIGRDIWQAISELAEEEAPDVLELALAWEATELDLHRLNWEMMHGPDGFLAAKLPTPPREVAITRVVRGADWPPQVIGAIPRCLFVIGTALTDTRIRPGAEYLGLLRQIERAGRAIHSRVLRGAKGQGASPSDVSQAMADFAPEIVQFICHGEFDEWDNAHLELAADPGEEESGKMRDSEQLSQYLRAGKKSPTILVLSACNTGQSSGEVEMRGAHETAPMASQLVNKGIPVVIGMAGRVADSACRHFTRRFGEAIVKGEPLVKATAEGRRAAFAYDDQSPEETVDWAFPAVFLSAKVLANYIPAPSPAAEKIPPTEGWVASYHKKRGAEPAFCGRHELFDAYYDLFDVAKPSVLGAYVGQLEPDKGFGKTRLLRELTVQAIRDGHIPVVVSSDSQNCEPPETVDALLTELLKALNKARHTYGIDKGIDKPTWQVSALRDLLQGKDAEINDDVEEAYEEAGDQVTAQVIKVALEKDMTYLIRAAHAKYKFLRDEQGSAILFLDDVHKYDERFLNDWLGGDVLGRGGLRRDHALRRDEGERCDPAQTVLPVVMTFSTHGAPNTILKTIKERGQSLGWLRLEQLGPFPRTQDVDLMAYEQVLLNPFDERGVLRPNVSNKAYALNHKADPEDREFWCNEIIREDYRGLPSYFTDKKFYKTVEIACRYHFLVEADDERKLREYMET